MGKYQGVKHVTLLPDGCGTFSRRMGMLVDKDNLGFGLRSWRYSMVVEDGEITKVFVEPGLCDNAPGDPFEVSDAETMLAHIESLKACTRPPERRRLIPAPHGAGAGV